jgi:Holliday junction resolvase RusA-like endonuclease
MRLPEMAIFFEIPGEAVAFARSGGNGRIRFTPKRQRDFMGAVKTFASRAMAGQPPLDGPLEMSVRATYLTPDSWSQKKKDRAKWRTSKPDADNIAKLLQDSMNKIVFADDAQVARLVVEKQYGPIAQIVVTVWPLLEGDGV